MKRVWINWISLALWVVAPLPSYAQTEGGPEEGLWENLAEEDAIDQEGDLSMFEPSWQAPGRSPVDLNRASNDALLALPGMNETLILHLRGHQSRFGPLTSLYELQAVPGFSEEKWRRG